MNNTVSRSSHVPFDPVRLRQARQQKGFTIEEASLRTSINKMTLLRYETGDIHTISPERLVRLANAYGTSPAWLTGISPEQEFFFVSEQLLLSPDGSCQPSHLGQRLLACLHYLSGNTDPK